MKDYLRISYRETLGFFTVVFLCFIGVALLPIQSEALMPSDAVLNNTAVMDQTGMGNRFMEEAGIEQDAMMEEESREDYSATDAEEEEYLDDGADLDEEEPSDVYMCSGELVLRYGEYRVSGDRGRFREDNWMNDNGRGGIEWISIDCVPPGDCGYNVHFHGKAIYDDWYDGYLFVDPVNSDCFFKSAYTAWRHYFDGTTKFKDSQEIDDRNIYLDRRTYLAEIGWAPECRPNFLFGWHRLENDGVSPTLRGVSSGFTGPYNQVSLLHEDGTTDNLYAEVSNTFCCKYNVSLKTEYEQYIDHQHGPFSTGEHFKEHDYFKIWRQYALFDTFLDCNTYASLNYMYFDVRNTTSREVIDEYEDNDANNRRYAHIGMGRYNKQRFMGVCFLTFDARFRAELNETSLKSDENNIGNRHYGLYYTKGSFDQRRFEESLRLTYKGFYRTTLTADAFLEQRHEDRKWYVDKIGANHFSGGQVVEQITKASGTLTEDINRKTDVDYWKQQYTLTAVRRFSPCLKGTLRGRYTRRVRDYHERKDTLAQWDWDTDMLETDPDRHYPGYLGDLIHNQGEATAKVDWQINSCLNTFLYYQWREGSYKSDIGGRTARRTGHRAAGTVSWDATRCLYLSATGIYENYRVDTPMNADNCPTWAPHSQPYDYKGDNYTAMVNGIYGINPETTVRFGYRRTEGLGSVDFAGDYAYQKFDFGIWHDVAGLGEVSLDYHYLHFNDYRKDHDNYDAHGWAVTWKHFF